MAGRLNRLRAAASPVIADARLAFARRAQPAATPPIAGPTLDYGKLWDVESFDEAKRLCTPDGEDSTGADLGALINGMFADGDVVVDLGCGVGRVAQHLANRAGELWLADASTGMLDFSRQALGGHRNTHFARCHGSQVPAIAPGSADIILCAHVLDRIEREDAYLLLRDIRRMLRTGGMAFIVVPNLLSGRHFTSFKRRAETNRIRDPRRPRPFTSDEIERLSSAANLQAMAFDPSDDLRVTLYRR